MSDESNHKFPPWVKRGCLVGCLGIIVSVIGFVFLFVSLCVFGSSLAPKIPKHVTQSFVQNQYAADVRQLQAYADGTKAGEFSELNLSENVLLVWRQKYRYAGRNRAGRMRTVRSERYEKVGKPEDVLNRDSYVKRGHSVSNNLGYMES